MVPECASELRQRNMIHSVPEAEEPKPVPVVLQPAAAAAMMISVRDAFSRVSIDRVASSPVCGRLALFRFCHLCIAATSGGSTMKHIAAEVALTSADAKVRELVQ